MKSFVEENTWSFTVDPLNDPFCADYRIHGFPAVPLAMSIELMAQAACRGFQADNQGEACMPAIAGVRVHSHLVSQSEDAFAIELSPSRQLDGMWTVRRDHRDSEGVVMERNVCHVSCVIDRHPVYELECPACSIEELKVIDSVGRNRQGRAESSESNRCRSASDAPVYRGPALPRFEQIKFGDYLGLDQVPVAVADYRACKSDPLWGKRKLIGMPVTSPAVVDLMLDLASSLAKHVSGQEALPVAIDQLVLGRRPNVDEQVSFLAKWWVSLHEGDGAVLSVVAMGQDGAMIARLIGVRAVALVAGL
ncbi:polyketide synthase dehydratase domain-containing protein [Rhodopirellula sp. MGV]|uniref:polyketide synthase dehydratase domain-containing protein n=1 Tax=Rhodopirellula sp. MGV TaxID=2023130 RepID=UPI000B9753CB|nr:polyketide synthase dehydratase domain-containing protein [Rhodopirellula sp. MGV]OYP29445.1 hypothetical protein CGZ80_24930 [Rhodopirellula sp. MGV]PNY35751.1 hypothetical protein C2E31_16885 [Rhodopirellula baltica]